MNEFKRISVTDAIGMVQDPNTIVIDIRDEESFNQEHILNSIHVSTEEFPFFVEKTSKEQRILVVCYHGNSSQGVAHYLALQGFEDVYSLDGGYNDWKLAK